MFSNLVSRIEYYLNLHHQLYNIRCKAELWEEIFARCLSDTNFGTDWKPNFNHTSGVDQTTNCGISCSNKSGSISNDCVEFSGSRLGKFDTLSDKLNFLSSLKQDYILCLSTDKKEWSSGIKRYYFVVFDSKIFDYSNQKWENMNFIKGTKKGTLKGWKCSCDKYDATIVESMSSQLWTKVKLDFCEEFYDITIR
jgi:hypothetical protein